LAIVMLIVLTSAVASHGEWGRIGKEGVNLATANVVNYNKRRSR
jgi:hypothetical protein